MTKTYIISALVEHKPGVLYKISNMFWRRGFNIESVAIGTAEQEDLARITITIEGEEKDAEQFVGHLEKLIDVLKATRLDPKKAVIRELALVKLKAKDAKLRSDIFHYVDVFRGRIVDVSPETATVEIVGSKDKIDAFISLTKSIGLVEVARTGETALIRGPESVRLDECCNRIRQSRTCSSSDLQRLGHQRCSGIKTRWKILETSRARRIHTTDSR
jgi:acetolactate synthase-1/3 small subunit